MKVQAPGLTVQQCSGIMMEGWRRVNQGRGERGSQGGAQWKAHCHDRHGAPCRSGHCARPPLPSFPQDRPFWCARLPFSPRPHTPTHTHARTDTLARSLAHMLAQQHMDERLHAQTDTCTRHTRTLTHAGAQREACGGLHVHASHKSEGVASSGRLSCLSREPPCESLDEVLRTETKVHPGSGDEPCNLAVGNDTWRSAC